MDEECPGLKDGRRAGARPAGIATSPGNGASHGEWKPLPGSEPEESVCDGADCPPITATFDGFRLLLRTSPGREQESRNGRAHKTNTAIGELPIRIRSGFRVQLALSMAVVATMVVSFSHVRTEWSTFCDAGVFPSWNGQWGQVIVRDFQEPGLLGSDCMRRK